MVELDGRIINALTYVSNLIQHELAQSEADVPSKQDARSCRRLSIGTDGQDMWQQFADRFVIAML